MLAIWQSCVSTESIIDMIAYKILTLYIGALVDNIKIDLKYKTDDLYMIRLLYSKYITCVYL